MRTQTLNQQSRRDNRCDANEEQGREPASRGKPPRSKRSNRRYASFNNWRLNGAVRSIKSWRVLLVEKALYCALAHDETAAGYWAYQAARDYAEKYDPRYGTGLIPPSARFVAEIAAFWQALLWR